MSDLKEHLQDAIQCCYDTDGHEVNYKNGDQESGILLEDALAAVGDVVDSYNCWISVDERLPEDDDHIIMCTEHGDRFSGRGRVLIGNLNHPEPSVGKMTRYTHWQLMPPAPKQ